MTVTDTRSPSSVKSWVMPIFRPRMPAMSKANLDVDAGREMVQPLSRINRLVRRLMYVDQALVRADLEVLARVLVLERALDHHVHVLLRGQRHRSGHGRAGALGGLHDLGRSAVDGVVIVGLEPDPDLVLRYRCHVVLSCAGARPPGEPRPVAKRVKRAGPRPRP